MIVMLNKFIAFRDLPHMNAIYLQDHFAGILKDIERGESAGVRTMFSAECSIPPGGLPHHSDWEGDMGGLPHQPGGGNRHASRVTIS